MGPQDELPLSLQFLSLHVSSFNFEYIEYVEVFLKADNQVAVESILVDRKLHLINKVNETTSVLGVGSEALSFVIATYCSLLAVQS